MHTLPVALQVPAFVIRYCVDLNIFAVAACDSMILTRTEHAYHLPFKFIPWATRNVASGTRRTLEARRNASRVHFVIVRHASVRVAEREFRCRSNGLSLFVTAMSTLKRVLASGQKDKHKQDLPADVTKLKELTIGNQPGKTSEFVLTEDTLYVMRPSDRK